jgi:hypothetical protein
MLKNIAKAAERVELTRGVSDERDAAVSMARR